MTAGDLPTRQEVEDLSILRRRARTEKVSFIL